VDLGAWLVWGTSGTFGGLDSNELPRAAVPPSTEQTLSMSARQSRLRAALGLPSDGLLGAARLDGLVEVDFMGGSAGGDPSMPLIRLRHAWLSATWKDAANLTVLLGQSWGLMGGPNAPTSLGHLAVPRFSGAGLLYRRAPQLRASAAWGCDLALKVEGALLAPMDRARTPAPTAANPDRPPPTGVGERSGLPDAEGRVSLLLQRGGQPLLEVGLSGHAGRERWLLTGGGQDANATVDSYGGALDARLELSWLRLLAGAYLGKNLDVLNTLSAGVTASLDAQGQPVALTGVTTMGGFGQVEVVPLPWLHLLAGAGIEQADRNDLAPNPASGTVPLRNLQVSFGALVDLTSRWQAGLEYTTYLTRYVGTPDRDLTSSQLELATRYAF
jgi:hypothetical protein